MRQNETKTFADRQDRLYIVAESINLATIFTNTRITEKTEGVMLVLEKGSSHIEAYLRRNTKRVRLVWRTYFQDLQPDQLGRGFRILAYPSGKYIIMTVYSITRQEQYTKSVRLVCRTYLQDLQPFEKVHHDSRIESCPGCYKEHYA